MQKWYTEPAALEEIKGLQLNIEIFIFGRNSPTRVVWTKQDMQTELEPGHNMVQDSDSF